MPVHPVGRRGARAEEGREGAGAEGGREDARAAAAADFSPAPVEGAAAQRLDDADPAVADAAVAATDQQPVGAEIELPQRSRQAERMLAMVLQAPQADGPGRVAHRVIDG